MLKTTKRKLLKLNFTKNRERKVLEMMNSDEYKYYERLYKERKTETNNKTKWNHFRN